MRTRTLRAGTASLRLLAATALTLSTLTLPSLAQDMPPRAIGTVDVNAITTAPLMHQRTVEVDADPTAVFDYVAANENWPDWFGDQVTGVEGDQSARTFALGNGASLQENIVTFEEPSGEKAGVYGWQHPAGNPFGYANHYAAIEVAPDAEDGQGSLVTVRSYFASPDASAIMPTVEGGAAAIGEGIRSNFGGPEDGQVVSGLNPLTITTTRIVKAPRDTVWRVVADEFGEVAKWASVISENTIEGADDADGLLGAARTCFIPGFGSSVSERVTVYDEEAGQFEYEVLQGLPPFVEKGTSAWTITAIDAETTKIVSTVTMEIADGTPAMPVGLTRGGFAQVMTVSLDDLVHYVETGEPHPRQVASAQ